MFVPVPDTGGKSAQVRAVGGPLARVVETFSPSERPAPTYADGVNCPSEVGTGEGLGRMRW